MKKETEDKIETLQNLFNQKQILQKQMKTVDDAIESILEDKTAPNGRDCLIEALAEQKKEFSIYNAIISVLSQHPDGLSNDKIFRALQEQYPDQTDLSQKDVTLALVYLNHKRKQIEPVSRAVYRIRK